MTRTIVIAVLCLGQLQQLQAPRPPAPGDRDKQKELRKEQRRATDQEAADSVAQAAGLVKDLQTVDKKWVRFKLDGQEMTVEKWRVFANPTFAVNAKTVGLAKWLRRSWLTHTLQTVPQRGVVVETPVRREFWHLYFPDLKPLGEPGHLRGGETVTVLFPDQEPDRVYLVVITKPPASEKGKPADSPAQADERKAAALVKLGKSFQGDAKGAEREAMLTKARGCYEQVIEDYPDTKAAAEAKKLLEGLK